MRRAMICGRAGLIVIEKIKELLSELVRAEVGRAEEGFPKRGS